MQKDMLRASDIAPRLGVTTGRVYQLIAAGEIPAVRLGGAIRIPLEAWEQWLDAQTQRAVAGTPDNTRLRIDPPDETAKVRVR
jgi:excisionase family DNA binding protein